MHTTLSPVTVQRFVALQGELIGLVEQDYTGLSPKLEQIIRACFRSLKLNALQAAVRVLCGITRGFDHGIGSQLVRDFEHGY